MIYKVNKWFINCCSNEFDPQWTDIECYWFKPPHDLQHMHLKLTKHGKFCKQNNQLPTKSHELKDNSNDLAMSPDLHLLTFGSLYPLGAT